MNTRNWWALAVVLLASVVTCKSQVIEANMGDPIRVIGAVHKDIAESSSIASATISSIQNEYKAGTDIKVHVVITNKTDHDLTWSPFSGVLVFNVRDSNGNLAPETNNGCKNHFFSPCHTTSPMPTFTPSEKNMIAPHKASEFNESLNIEYNLSSAGIYTVVSYIYLEDTDSYVKSNTITITVVPNTDVQK